MADLFGVNGPLDDDWLRLGDDAEAPSAGRLLVSLDRLRRGGEALRRRAVALAVQLEPDVDVDIIAGKLSSLKMIELNFPSFTDGRAFSQARELRERFNYAGDIRASGEVLRDQLAFMVRCGFTQFDLSRESGAAVAAALGEFSYAYQPRDQVAAGEGRRHGEAGKTALPSASSVLRRRASRKNVDLRVEST